MFWLQSAQGFVRALKAPSDPPQVGEPLKIEIARTVWDRSDTYIPNKAQIIYEWILTKLLKDRGNKGSSNPVTDARYWELLSDAITCTSGRSSQNANAKSQLLSILNKTPLAPVVTSLFNLLSTLPPVDAAFLLQYARACLDVLWPLAVPKFTAEALLDCSAAFVGSLLSRTDEDRMNQNYVRVGLMICQSHRSSLGNSSNKKKLYQIFVQSHLPTWLTCMRNFDPSTTESPLLSSIYSAGVDTLFNLDMLRNLTSLTPISSDSLFSTLLTLVKSSPEAVMAGLPGLFLSYVHAIKKHRSAVFGSGSSGQENAGLSGQIQTSGMRFFVACDDVLRATQEDSSAVWTARVRLLEVVEKEALFGSHVHAFAFGGQGDEEAHLTLKKITTDAIVRLESATANNQDAKTTLIRTDLAVQCLVALVRVDYDLIFPSTPRLLQALLVLPRFTGSWDHPSEKTHLEQQSDTLLSLILAHHSKTRTLPSYFETLLGPLTSLTPRRITTGEVEQTQSTYRACHESRILSQHLLGQISRSCLAYVTPLQITEIVDVICEALKVTFDAFNHPTFTASEGEGAKLKKRKGSKRESEMGEAGAPRQEVQIATTRFALVGKLAGAVMPSLPLQSLTADDRRKVATTVRRKIAQSVIVPTLQRYISSRGKAGITSPKKRKAALMKEDQWMIWATETATAAALRLDYAIAATPQDGLGHSVLANEDEAELKETTFQSFKHDLELGTAIQSPELVPEMIRSFMKSGLASQLQDDLFAAIVRYLGRYLNTSVGWRGMMSELDAHGTHHEAAVALLYNVSERWLGAFEKSAPVSELAHLVAVIMNLAVTALRGSARDRLYAHEILSRMLRSAEFWELSRLRTALISRINALTAPYEKFDLSDLLAQIRGGNALMQDEIDDNLRQALAVYKLLLYVPQEYIPRSNRGYMLKRAVILDVIAMMDYQRRASAPASSDRTSDILSIRAFLVRTYKSFGTVDHEALVDTAKYLLQTDVYLDGEQIRDLDMNGPQTCRSFTLELLRMYTNTMIRKAEKGDDVPLLEFLTQISHFSSFPAANSYQKHLPQQCLLHVIDDLTAEFTLDSFSSQIQACFRALHNSLYDAVTRNLSTLDLESDSPDGYSRHLEAWPRVLRFGRWLHSDIAVPPLGRNIVVKVSPRLAGGHRHAHLCRSILSVLLEEYRCAPKVDNLSQIEIATAFYLTAVRTSGSEGHEGIDRSMGLFSKALSVSDFTHSLELLSEAISSSRSSPLDFQGPIHLSTLFLRDAPEGTLKVTQNFVTECLNIFANYDLFFCGPLSLRLAVLTFISRHFSERPAVVRTQDVNNVWSLLSRFLRGCEQHDEHTSETIFQQIVNILSALIRLRRDLLLPTLPHLGFILRQLIKTTRAIRPHLGGKQTTMVTDTLPMWINATQPLPVDASRALGRLLTSLGTKTVVRTHGAAPENQKAESLAKPFSKHATYVVQAYIETMNDPLCVMPSEVRKELYPGLFVLCDMMNDHNRDAMMASALDAGGKVTMKSSWKEYEKQKYVGKG
ncbi:hypothetical protein NEOLEDRAFT_1099032 [Neolentinus lepideus HHB14362 ss-1]|uniref:Nucleolar 27S pre-rRNA processing Urb2/Npa2 C-terminal domain-containing protein n=1 Tax=Neolentinus lepideus HHB14362 ss-1 TaxID=1314782 RepID=A0A165PZR5_9AGAM|nr:hypothetical protein NEOLEDRAFT_1099032 [Neolentinus lepideus HHB14362 ss-1]